MHRRAVLRAALSVAPAVLLSACAGLSATTASPRAEATVTPATPSPPATTSPAPATRSPLAPRAAPVKPVPFTGTVQHIMCHPLVAYPQRAFHGSKAQGYNEWFITAGEFDKILPQVHANDYILIDPHLMFAQTTVNGATVIAKRELLLPPGKKPLILSIDDMNYYDYMRQGGNVYRLVLDGGGRIATYSVDLQGTPVVSRDNEIVPLLDTFVADHPDFSFQGAKGLIALTGYQGILGYRTADPTAADYAATRRQAAAVVARLKATGWRFACHGWGHLDAATISSATLVADTGRWEAQVAPLVGPTDVYVYPFGAGLAPDDAKFKYLLSRDFRVFFGIGPIPFLRMTDQWMAMDRVQVDGLSLETEQKMLAPFFDAHTVLDRAARGL